MVDKMFTGLVAGKGVIAEHLDRDGDIQLSINTPDGFLVDAVVGESICVNGVCLTATSFQDDAFSCDVSKETINCSTLGELKTGVSVNLERALLPSNRLGGHIVSGHVDGVGEVVDRTADGQSTRFSIKAPDELAKYIAAKGSITINGVSLTVNAVEKSVFSVNIIPHSFTITNLDELNTGSRVNLEVDIIARHVERMLNYKD